MSTPTDATFTPRPGAAPYRRMVLAQARMETRLLLRNGEQLLLAVVIPLIVLVGGIAAADHVHVIDRGRLIASGSPFELTRASGSSTIRLVVTEPFPPEAPASLQAALGHVVEVRPIDDRSLLITGTADSTTLATVSAWCERNGVLPESLNLGQRNLEDVFLELTGRGLSA